jgi:dolichol kinase
MAAIGRSTIVVFLCGFGGGHAVLLRRQAGGLKLAVVLVVAVAAYELSATVFEAALVQIRPSQNRQAPLAGTVLCAIWGLIAGTVFNPPVTVGGGFVIGVAAALAAAVGRALPALFDVEHGDGGLEIAAVAASLFVAAPVVYYVARVVL